MTYKRRIFFLTAVRAEYDLLFPVMKAVSEISGLRAEIIAAGAHMSPFHGMNIDNIRQDGFPIAGCIESLISSESWQGRLLSFSELINGLTYLLTANRPDVLYVAGDREEALAGALVGNFLRIPVAHQHGGDRCIASDVDEVLRPAISKLAHLHFTANEAHRQRLIRMGELPEYIWASGATGLDRLREESDVPAAVLNETYGVDVDCPFFLLIHHPTSTFANEDGFQEMRAILQGVLSLGYPVFCSYPNTDPGNVAIRRAIDEARSANANLIVYHNLPRSHFVSLYRRCAAIVGNSSSIVIESSFLKVPGILVGPRQDLREVSSNVLRVAPSAAAVRAACLQALEDQEFREIVRQCPSLYGDGYAAPRIAEVLANVELRPELLLKTITY